MDKIKLSKHIRILLFSLTLYLVTNTWLGILSGIFLFLIVNIWLLVLLIYRLILIFRLKRDIYRAEILILFFIILILNFTPIKRASLYLRAYTEHFKYVETIEEIEQGNINVCQNIHCKIDDGPPIRVAFVWDGFVDNWSGVIYDPTGIVMNSNLLKVDFSNRNDSEYVKAGRLFGGDMTDAIHLWGDWYYCCFT